MSSTTASPAKFVLYSNRLCPFAQRARIALRELKADFEEVEIDLSKPRPEWYLKINPRGLVPALKISGTRFKFDDTIIVESDIIIRLLADLYPDTFLPTSVDGPLSRSQVNQFIGTFDSALSGFLVKIAQQESDKAREELASKAANIVVNELERQLEEHGSKPFFGGKTGFGLVELFAASFIARIWAFKNQRELIPASFFTTVLEKAPLFTAWAERVVAEKVVKDTFPEQEATAMFLDRYDVRRKKN